MADDLCRLGNLPLIPLDLSLVPVILTKLTKPSKVVVTRLNDVRLSSSMVEVLKVLGVIIMQECPVNLHPTLLQTFVQPPSIQGVLHALTTCSSTMTVGMVSAILLEKVDNDGKRSLRNFISKAASLNHKEKELLLSFPLFETLSQTFVSKKEGLRAAPEDMLPVTPRREFIDIKDDDAKRLVRMLDIKVPTLTEFLCEEIFPDVKEGRYSEEEIDKLMAFVLERYHYHVGVDARFEDKIKDVPFVPTRSGRTRALDLFDPRKDLLKTLFAGEDVFPIGTQYNDPAVLVILEKLGMKSEGMITAQNLYQTAKNIINTSSISTARQKSKAIMAYLTSNPKKLEDPISGTSLGLLLQDIAWITILKQKPRGFPESLQLWGENEKERNFFKPTEVRSVEQGNLIGSVQPIIEVNSSLARCFGWDKNPCVPYVVEHLKNVVANYSRDEKPHYVLMLKDIYSFLSSVDHGDVAKALQEIEIPGWIWNGDGFSSPNVVLSVQPSIDLSPYIFALPSEMIQYSELFSKFGMREQCDVSFLLDVLGMIKEKYDSQPKAADVKKDLHLSIDILNEVKPDVGKQLPPDHQEKILLPTYVEGDAYLKLAPVERCMYCEDGWPGADTDDEEMDYFMVHPNIPNSTAELLNVRTLSNCMLDPDELAVGEEFGQEEKLTRRLSRLLEDYTDGFAVPKELVQNADDAGATEVRFLYDERTNEDALTCLIDERMRHCQGPALWAYNDAEFKDEDFENITKLSGATKEHDTEKIGKFGLGFNAVYNLTDVPMFVSRNHFVIFDPNTFYLGKAIRNKNKPGMKINTNRNTKKLRKFRNQFKPFNRIFGCDLHLDKDDNSYQGTLFRFPLRTKEQAIKSEIKQSDYDCTQVKELLQLFIRGAGSLLLFTQNVRSVSIFHLSSECTKQPKPTKIFEVTKSLSEAGIIRELSGPTNLPLAASNLSAEDQFFWRQCNFLRASSDIAKYNKDAINSNTVLLRSALTIDINTTMTESGHRFFENKVHLPGDVETWLVVSSMGKGQAMQFSEKDKSLLPSGGVAVQLSRSDTLLPVPVFDDSSGSHHKGNVFCYLPLPIHSGLPVHVNGAFAVASNRRNLKEKTEDDKGSIGVEWNNVLLKDSVCSAYLDLLEDLKTATEVSKQYQFHSLWPKSCEVEPNCDPLARSFYEHLANGSTSLFSDGDKWVAIGEVVFLEPQFRKDTQVGDISFEVLQLLAKDKGTVIDIPGDVYKSFVNYDLSTEVQARSYNKVSFFRELFFPNIGSVPPDLRDNLVLYALNVNSDDFRDMVKTYPCIPVSPHGQELKCPSQLVHPDRLAASLFCPEDGRFPCGTRETFLHPLQLFRLEQLGMSTNDLSWPEVAERAESVYNLNRSWSDAAFERAKKLIVFLEGKLEQDDQSLSSPGAIQTRLLQAKFLPVLKKPQTFPLKWKGSQFEDGTERAFVSPNKSFLRDKMYLVCCTEPIVDVRIPGNVKRFLKFNDRQATTTHVMSQINEAISTRVDISGIKEVRKVCNASYSFLQDALKSDEIQIAKFLQGKKFILMRNEFVYANQVAFSLPCDCSPYLYKVPEELSRFSRLMRASSVRDVFEVKDFICGLEQIKERFGERQMDKPTLHVAVNLAIQLGEALKAPGVEFTTDNKRTLIHLPNSNGVMRPVSELCIKDCPWIPGGLGVQFVSPQIPCTTSIELGVKTRREEALRHHALGLSFGQKEKLTNRLKRILTGYPCGKELLKELLQNADDAQATEICFIKDPRSHSKERVFEDSWMPLQGPALCVYNNKPFTKADIEGIQNLGEGSKGNDPNKTGQYGVGFNAVYHLTDVPSFMSSGEEIGDVLCVFDPHCLYVPDASPEEPGRMYTEVTKLKGLFPDVFICYLEERFPIENSTMFRFPLRTQEMADSSKLSSTPVTLEALDEMMEALKKELFEVLVFVNNVKKITLCDIDERSGQVVNSYSVEAVMTVADEVKRQKFATYIKQIGKLDDQRNDFSPNNIKVEKCSYVLNLRDSLGNEERWFIVQKIGLGNEVQKSIHRAYKNRDLGMLPRGGVACLLEKKSKVKEPQWRKRKVYCFLPLPLETDLPVHINGHFALDHEARRGLWRDEIGGYRSDWNSTLLKDVIASCYLTMLDEVRSFLQLPVLPTVNVRCSKSDLIEKLKAYEKLFPFHINFLDPYWQTLVTSVYRGMDNKHLRFLPVVREASDGSTQVVELTWLPPTGTGRDKAFFNNLETNRCFARHQKVFAGGRKDDSEENRQSFERILLQTGFNLVQFSILVFEALRHSSVDCCCITPHSVIEFYKTFNHQDSLCRIGSFPVDVGKTPFKDGNGVTLVLRYCKDHGQFLDDLSGLPLLLTQDNCLRVFSRIDRKFLSRYHDILPNSKDMFVHEQVMTDIFNDAAIHRAFVFMHFDVDAFARHLSGTLSQGYSGVWCPENTTEPSRHWIFRVWSFLAENSKTFLNDPGQIRCMLRPLSNWSLLPATNILFESRFDQENVYDEVTENILVPLRLAESVLDFTDFSSWPVVQVLRKLGLPELNSKVLSISGMSGLVFMEAYTVARHVVASLKSPASLLTSLDHKMSLNPLSLVGKLEPPDCITVLQYFNDTVGSLSFDDALKAKSKLKKLPFYRTTHGDLTSLDHQRSRVCILPHDMPIHEMDVLQREVDVVFLESLPVLSGLYRFLDLECLSTVDVYCEFILKHFKTFSKKARHAHLKYIRDRLLPSMSADKKDEQRVLNHLRSTEVITTKEEVLKRASCFHDPRNDVFRAMLPEDKFPPEPFKSKEWLSFLIKIGMVYEVSTDHFKTFAEKVAHEAATQRTGKTDERSKILVSQLLRRSEVLGDGLLEAVRGVHFVVSDPVSSDLLALHKQHGEREDGQPPYISFKDSVICDHAETVWTTAYLLPQWADPRFKFDMNVPWNITRDPFCNTTLARRKVLSEPTLDLVTSHCRNISRHFVKENDSKVSEEQCLRRKSVMKNIYKFLQEKVITNNVVKEGLENVPCILVEQGTRFAEAKQVVLELYESLEIKPFLYRVPHDLGEFHKLFQHLGCSNSVTTSHYAMVLETLHEQCQGKKLHPNEIKSALRAVRGLVEKLQQDPAEESRLSNLFLPALHPDKSCLGALPVVLRKSTELIFDDAPHLQSRLQSLNEPFVVDLQRAELQCSSSMNYKDLVMRLSPAVRPQMLSCVIEEKLADSLNSDGMAVQLHVADSLKKQICSEQFFHGVLRLIRHANHENGNLDETVVASIEGRLRNIEFIGMNKLETKLMFKGVHVPGSEAEVPHFVDKVLEDGKDIWKVYVNAEGKDSAAKIYLASTQVIAEACKGLLRDTVMFIPEMLRNDPSEIWSILDEMKIRQDDSYHASSSDLLPQPGSFIPIEDHHLLNESFEHFTPGEYVGYEMEDPSMLQKEGDATFIYAVIIEEVNVQEDSTLFGKFYKINVGRDKEPRMAEFADLYKFHRLQSSSLGLSEELGTATQAREKKKIFAEISVALEEAWRLPEERRRKIVKRLFLRWHPDKNLGDEAFCAEAFQHIQNEIARLESGETEEGETENRQSYETFFNFWRARAKRHHAQRQGYKNTFFQNYGTYHSASCRDSWSRIPPSFCKKNPQPGEARRWLRQAEADLTAADNDLATEKPSYEWVCFKCHQVRTICLSLCVIFCDVQTYFQKISPNAFIINNY